MPDTVFRAVFEADDRSFSSVMRRLKAESNEMASGMMSDANKIAAATGQNVNKVLEEQIALYEKAARLSRTTDMAALDHKRKLDLSEATTDAQRNKINRRYEYDKKQIVEDAKYTDLQIGILRDILAAIKDDAKRQIADDKAAFESNVRRVRSGDTEGMTEEEEFAARYQSDLNVRTTDEGKRGSWKDTAIGMIVAQQVNTAISKVVGIANGMATASDEEPIISQMWSVIPFAGDALAAASSRNVELSEQRDRSAYRLKSLGGAVGVIPDNMKFEEDIAKMRGDKITDVNAFMVRRQAEFDAQFGEGHYDAFTPSILTNPFQGQYWSENIFRHLNPLGMSDDELMGLDVARWSNLSDKDKLEKQWDDKIQQKKDEFTRRNEEFKNMWSYESAGVDQVEFLDKATRLAPALGSGANIAGQTRGFINLTQGGSGLDESSAYNAASMMRYNVTGAIADTDLARVVGAVYTSMAANGFNKAMFGEFMNDVTGLGQSRLSRGLQSVDISRLGDIKGTFGSMFGLPMMRNETILGIEQSMSNPADEYQQAMNYKIYADQKARSGEATSYVDFMKWQETPYESGLFSGTMDYYKSIYGDTDYARMAFKKRFNLNSWQQAEALMNPKDGSYSPLGKEGLSDKIAPTYFNAEDYATSRQKSQAEIQNAFITSMEEGLAIVFEKVGTSIANKIAASNIPFLNDFAANIKRLFSN